jgi:hypothetical protein
MLSGVLVWQHEREPEKRFAFTALGVVSLLGVWTIPSYALFAGPVMALAGLAGPRRRNAMIGLVTLGAIALVYAPVAADVLSSSRRYGAKWGRQLDTPGEIADALRLYLFHDESFVWGPNDVGIGLLWLRAAVLALRSRSTPESRAARTMLGGGLFLIAASFALGTPPPRILAPALVAFAFSVALILRDRLPPLRFVRTRALVACGLAIVVLPHDRQTVHRFEFVPRERWMAIAELIDHVLPDDMTVGVRFRPDQLALYTKSKAKLRDEVDPADLDAGRSAILLNGLDPRTDNDPVAQDPRYGAIRFKQNRGRHQTLYVAPPPRRLIDRVTLVEQVPADRSMDLRAATDGDLTTRAQTVRPLDERFRYVELHAGLRGDEPVRSLLLFFDGGTGVGRVEVEARLDDGTLYSVPRSRIAIWGSAVVVDLDRVAADPKRPKRIESLVIRVRPRAVDGRRAFSLQELWAYPRRLGASADGP